MAGTLAAQISKPPVFHTQERLPSTGWRVMDVLVQLNGHTHFSGVEIYMAEKPEHLANTNIVLLSLSLGTVNLKRFEWQNHIADLESSSRWLKSIADSHRRWGDRWLSATVHLGVRRPDGHSGPVGRGN